ncbi:MAG: hypothetical protein QXD08_09405 [Pyrobaculum sp.]|jgi:hypothetical protein
MNLTFEALSGFIVAALGIYLFNIINYDYRLLKILKNYPLAPVVKSGGIIDIDKLGIFLQNYRYEIEKIGDVQLEMSNNMIRVWGKGEVVVVFEAHGYLGVYKVRRVVKVTDTTSSV